MGGLIVGGGHIDGAVAVLVAAFVHKRVSERVALAIAVHILGGDTAPGGQFSGGGSGIFRSVQRVGAVAGNVETAFLYAVRGVLAGEFGQIVGALDGQVDVLLGIAAVLVHHHNRNRDVQGRKPGTAVLAVVHLLHAGGEVVQCKIVCGRSASARDGQRAVVVAVLWSFGFQGVASRVAVAVIPGHHIEGLHPCDCTCACVRVREAVDQRSRFPGVHIVGGDCAGNGRGDIFGDGAWRCRRP